VCKQKGVNFNKSRYVCVIFLQYSYKCVHVKKLSCGNHRTTALSLAGKGRVVAEKRATRTTVKLPFAPWLNAVYYPPTYVLVFLEAPFLLAFPPISYMQSSSQGYTPCPFHTPWLDNSNYILGRVLRYSFFLLLKCQLVYILYCLDYPHLFRLDAVTFASWLVSFDLIISTLRRTMAYASSFRNNVDSLWLKFWYYL
jgi:hypothetical protein